MGTHRQDTADETGEPRGAARKVLQYFIYAFSIGLSVALLYYAYFNPFERIRFANLFLGPALALFYLTKIRDSIEGGRTSDGRSLTRRIPELVESVAYRARPAIYSLAGLAAIGASLYIEQDYQRLRYDVFLTDFTVLDHFVAVVLLVLVIHTTYLAFGPEITAVVFLSIGYAYFGPYLPGILNHSGLTATEIIENGGIKMGIGIYSFILGVGVTWVGIFILFAGMARSYGAIDYLLSIGEEVGNSFQTGVVQSAVLSSMIIGSLTGSAAANTATTGSFTIPLMKNQGVRSNVAAAIEGVASSGGQMLPPIMGVAAFLMADILGIPYVQVIQAGVLPASLFYFSVAVSVFFLSHRYGWTKSSEKQFDLGVLRGGVHFAIPLIVLLYCLVYLRLTPLRAGLYTTVTLVGTMTVMHVGWGVRDQTVPSEVKSLVENTVDGLNQGLVDLVPLVPILASMGVIIAMFEQTGLAPKISHNMVAIAGGSLVVLLVLSMILSLFLGLGMPTPAAYILVVVLVAPSLMEMGVPSLSTHMFVFYFAMLSAITPPIAISVAIGTRIADGEFIPSCVEALRIGAAGFVIPYAFIVNDGLLRWSFPTTIFSTFFVLVGLYALVVSTVGFNGRETVDSLPRAGYFALAFGIFFGPFQLQVAGSLLAVGLFVTVLFGWNLRTAISRLVRAK